MATTPLYRNELELFILRDLQSINDEYDNPFTQEQVDRIIKFIATDYSDRRLRIRADIAAKHVYDHVPRFVAYGYLNELLEKLGQNSPTTILENHVESLTFLIRELKGYFDGALWLIELESFLLENEKFVKEVEATEEFVKEIFQDRLKSIEDEKKQCLVELQVANALSNCPLESEEEMSDDALIEYLVYSDVIKCFFEKEMEDVQAMMREVQLEMKPALEFDAKYKLDDLEFHLFAPTIIREKANKRYIDDKLEYLCPNKGSQSSYDSTSKGSPQASYLLKAAQVKEATFGKVSRWLEYKKNM
ncbi:hypothetical protein L195_g028215 [Trifolium pratense]|uniref:Uncharacterized protein n=2 Tax=Trifolium pratense TaxID=57577 RepID=A0A2K3L1B0_TRIPR|nr:hypothetical protein L195_g028215 [Trifolium pratense]